MSAALASFALSLAVLAGKQERTHIPGDVDTGAREEVRDSLSGIDPTEGGWQGEAFTERIGPILAALGAALSGERAVEQVVAQVARDDVLVAARLSLSPPVPRGPFTLQAAETGSLEEPRSGHAAFAELLQDLARLVGGERSGARIKWKVIAVESAAQSASTRLRLELVEPSGPAQVVAEVGLEWSLAEGGTPLVCGVSTLVAQVARLTQAGGAPLFQDVADAVIGTPAVRAQLAAGIPEWRARLDSALGVGLLGHQGLAVADVDGDGLEDVYLCQPGGLPNLLFLHRPDGTAAEIGERAGVDVLDATSSALLLDLDGDADPDLALAVGDELAIFENLGAGEFRPRARLDAPGAVSLCAADFDANGWPDIFATAYLGPYEQDTKPIPYHDAENGAPNHLFANGGEFRLVDASESSGLRAAPPRFSFAAAWEDFDRDGDPDLYVANDFGRNELWRNEGGRLVDVAAELGVEDISAGMGVTWGDFDADGWPDLYVSNMFSSAGNRVTYDRSFRRSAAASEIASYRRHARGNSLFRNVDGRRFEDVSAESGTGMGRWAWGALSVELDNDGRPDLVVPNGFVTNEAADDL